MAGGSIASAKAGLIELTEALQPADRFSYSRFGSTCQHDLRRLVSHTPTNVDILRVLIDKTGAYLGGTEMRRALQSLFDDVPVAEARGPVDVLLITDGQVEDRSAIVDAARASGHRIFVIGVGSSPNAHLLRETAEATCQRRSKSDPL